MPGGYFCEYHHSAPAAPRKYDLPNMTKYDHCTSCYRLSFLGYSLRMLVFGLAILIAARPDLDNPGCYNRSGWDIVRGILEGISMLFFLYKAYDEVSEIIA